MMRSSRRDEDDFGRSRDARNIPAPGVTDGDRRAGVDQHVRERPSDRASPPDQNDVFSLQFGPRFGENDTGPRRGGGRKELARVVLRERAKVRRGQTVYVLARGYEIRQLDLVDFRLGRHHQNDAMNIRSSAKRLYGVLEVGVCARRGKIHDLEGAADLFGVFPFHRNVTRDRGIGGADHRREPWSDAARLQLLERVDQTRLSRGDDVLAVDEFHLAPRVLFS